MSGKKYLEELKNLKALPVELVRRKESKHDEKFRMSEVRVPTPGDGRTEDGGLRSEDGRTEDGCQRSEDGKTEDGSQRSEDGRIEDRGQRSEDGRTEDRGQRSEDGRTNQQSTIINHKSREDKMDSLKGSKTLWGFGIAVFIYVLQNVLTAFNIADPDNLILKTFIEVVIAVSGFFGVYGVRDALRKMGV